MTNTKSYVIIFKSNERSTQPIFSRGIFPSRDEYDNIVGDADSYMALWPSGKAKVCNTSIPGSIPGGASNKKAQSKRTGLSCWMCYAQSATRLRKRSVAESGSHIRPKSVGELAHQRRGRDIFAEWRNSGIVTQIGQRALILTISTRLL